jgi:Holliday junction resolvase RusA-like endonuclease
MKIHLSIIGQLPRKSNSRRLVTNKSTGRAMFIKSKEALQYEKDFEQQVPRNARVNMEGKLALRCIIYYRSNRSDLSDELLCDMLEKAGVISNDRWIFYKEQAKVIDKVFPRVELTIEQMPEGEELLPNLSDE